MGAVGDDEGMARRIVGWAEDDAYSGWRHVLCYTRRPGVRKKIKKLTHRRERREGKREAQTDE